MWKICNIGEYLDYENCKCRKKIFDKLIDECSETIEEVKLAKITFSKYENENKYSFSTAYIVLMVAIFIIFTGISYLFCLLQLVFD